MSNDITFMTPGAVWINEAGKKSTLLFISNLELKPRVQERFPPQAVFLSEDGQVLTKPLDLFMEERTFFNVAPEVESMVDQLLAYRDLSDMEEAGETDAEEVPEDDGLELEITDEAPDADDEVVDDGREGVDLTAVLEPSLVSFTQEALPVHHLAALTLNSAVVAYSQNPLLNEGLTDHIIEFDRKVLEGAGVTVEGLESLFDPDSVSGVIPSFVVTDSFTVNWSTYLGVFPKMSKKHSIICLHLGSDSPEAVDQKLHQELSAVEVAVEVVPEDVVAPVAPVVAVS